MEDAHKIIQPIITAAEQVYSSLGPGFLEGIYGRALVSELKNRGLSV
jgi:GxxExxY protein